MSLSMPRPLTSQTLVASIDVNDVTHFLLELDALKRVNRRSYVTHTTRRENSVNTLGTWQWLAGQLLNCLSSTSIMRNY